MGAVGEFNISGQWHNLTLKHVLIPLYPMMLPQSNLLLHTTKCFLFSTYKLLPKNNDCYF